LLIVEIDHLGPIDQSIDEALRTAFRAAEVGTDVGLNWPAIMEEQPSMGIARERKISAFAAALLLSSLSLGECAPATAGSSLMDARAQVPPPKTSIFDPPPQREPAMTPDERLKLQKDLTNARDRHAPDGKARARPATAPTRPEKR
jgi:hypothetical protein